MRSRPNFRERATAVHARSRRLSAHGCACLCPADSEGQDAMQKVRVFKSVIPSRCSELLTLRYFGIGIGFNEIRDAVGSEAKVDTCISVEPQGLVDALRRSLNAGVYLRREVIG